MTKLRWSKFAWI